VDYLTWNERVAKVAPEIAERSKSELRAAKLELWVTGKVSPRARQELTALGFAVREQALPRPVEPAPAQ
jgi:hypothetical protein